MTSQGVRGGGAGRPRKWKHPDEPRWAPRFLDFIDADQDTKADLQAHSMTVHRERVAAFYECHDEPVVGVVAVQAEEDEPK